MAESPWSEIKVAELRQLWAAGASASDIARELGDGLTRCSVLGKINRLGFPRRKPPQPRKPRSETVKRGRPILRRPVFNTPNELPPRIGRPPGARPVRPAQPPLVGMRMLPLMALADGHCRWPFAVRRKAGEARNPGFLFCAADIRAEGGPYCACHWHEAHFGPR